MKGVSLVILYSIITTIVHLSCFHCHALNQNIKPLLHSVFCRCRSENPTRSIFTVIFLFAEWHSVITNGLIKGRIKHWGTWTRNGKKCCPFSDRDLLFSLQNTLSKDENGMVCFPLHQSMKQAASLTHKTEVVSALLFCSNDYAIQCLHNRPKDGHLWWFLEDELASIKNAIDSTA